MIVNILRQDYSKIELINGDEKITYNGPAHNLFHNDEVNINEDGSLHILFRSLPQYLVGELELYSSHIFKSSTRTPLYIFRPIDTHYPKFYVHSNGRTKYNRNILISINELDWNANNNLPHGKVYHIYGLYDDIFAMEHALCDHYNLLDDDYRLKNIPIVKYGYEISRTNIENEIYSIDPVGCLDIDDAFSIKIDNNYFHLWIHIADVYSNLMSWYDDASYIVSHLHQGSSVYLRTQIKHMLSSIWAKNICSLLEGTVKNMLTLYIRLDEDDNIICNLYPSVGKITKNYNYDNSVKLCRDYYNKVNKIYSIFLKKYGNDNMCDNIDNTHKFIEALMIIYNLYYGNEITKEWPYKLLRVQKNEKYNMVICQDDINYDKDLRKFLMIIYRNNASYSLIEGTDEHSSLGVYGYTHATSPIRRRIDLINQMMYYNKNMVKRDIMIGIVSDINDYEKRVKRLTRDLNKIYLLERVYYKPDYETGCYIYNVNMSKNRISVYFPKEKLSFKIRIVMIDLVDMYETRIEDNCVITRNKQTNVDEKRLEMNKLLKVKVNGEPRINKLDDGLLIEFF
jgi:exoribonuclease R